MRATLALVALLAGCSLEHEVSRVSVAGTHLALVVVQDEKRMFRYRVLAGDEPVSAERLFSGPCSEPLPDAVVTQESELVRISWAVRCQGQGLFVEFDLRRGQIRRDSNDADAPPVIQAHRQQGTSR